MKFNLKSLVGVLCVTFVILFVSAPVLEAGHHHRRSHCHRSSSVNVHLGPVVSSPAYVVRSPAYVIASPAYEPVYVTPSPVVAYPVYQPVYVAPQPQLFTGFSFNWFFH